MNKIHLRSMYRRGLKVMIIEKRPEPTRTSNALRVNIRTLELMERCGATPLFIKSVSF